MKQAAIALMAVVLLAGCATTPQSSEMGRIEGYIGCVANMAPALMLKWWGCEARIDGEDTSRLAAETVVEYAANKCERTWDAPALYHRVVRQIGPDRTLKTCRKWKAERPDLAGEWMTR